MYSFNLAHVKCGVLIKDRNFSRTVEDSTEPAFNSFESLQIDLDVAFYMYRIDLFNSVHVKFDV